jgi:hypothetical protein
MSKNDITGDALTSKIGNSKLYEENYDNIFGKTCQNSGCRAKATVHFRLANGKKQWRCSACATRKPPMVIK